jgi:hypothetical protein
MPEIESLQILQIFEPKNINVNDFYLILNLKYHHSNVLNYFLDFNLF